LKKKRFTVSKRKDYHSLPSSFSLCEQFYFALKKKEKLFFTANVQKPSATDAGSILAKISHYGNKHE
jgi:hypothetical protein